MWTAITYVSSGLTLAAFIAAVGAYIFRRSMLHKEKLIQMASEAERGELVALLLDRLKLHTEDLSAPKRFELAKETLRRRAESYRIGAIVIVFILILSAMLAGYAIYRITGPPPPPRPVTFHLTQDDQPLDIPFTLDAIAAGIKMHGIDGRDGVATTVVPGEVKRFDSLVLHSKGYELEPNQSYDIDEDNSLDLATQKETVIVAIHVICEGKPVNRDFDLEAAVPEEGWLPPVKGKSGIAQLKLFGPAPHLVSVRLHIRGYKPKTQGPYQIDEHDTVRIETVFDVVTLEPHEYPAEAQVVWPDEETCRQIKTRPPLAKHDRVTFRYRNATKEDMYLFLYNWDRRLFPPKLPPFITPFPPWIAFEFPAETRVRHFDTLTEYAGGAGYFGVCVVPVKKIGDRSHEYHFECHNLFEAKVTTLNLEETEDPIQPYRVWFDSDEQEPPNAGDH